MALHVPKPPGFSSMLKDGARVMSGLEEAVYRNIDACKELAQTTRSAYGPNGQNKMVINHLEKLFVTSDAATILRELEVQHPAAKMLVMASQQQEQEAGDGTNFVLVFAGALLEKAEELLRMGLSVTEVVDGYEIAMRKTLEILPELVVGQLETFSNKEEVTKVIKSSVMSKQYGLEDFLAKVIAEACISLHNDEKNYFNTDSVRVSKVLGAGVNSSIVIQGMVFKRMVEGDVQRAEKCKIAVYSCPLDAMQTETKGTVLIKSAAELKDYSKGEENIIEEQIKAIAETGCKVIVSGGKVGELALHYANKHKLLVLRLLSKFDLRRLCKAVGATPLPRVTPPTAEELGFCDLVSVDEIGDTPVIVFKQEKHESAVATIVIRGATENVMDDIERAIDDGVNTFKCLTKDKRYLAGAGATEIELAKRLASFGETCAGLEQYAIKQFAEAFEVVPRALAENAGIKSTELLSKMYAVHNEGQTRMGFDIEAEQVAVKDAVEAGILDMYYSKYWGIRFATTAANTVLRVDQIIMAKAAGGPKPKQNKDWDED